MTFDENEPRRRRKQSARGHYVDGFVTGVLAALLFVFLLLGGRELVSRLDFLKQRNKSGEKKRIWI